ncbi:hypothetical protein D4S03_04175 [bacterium]|nr:MAG: hypothetical protein D4S03_04175 [bacterium]
MLKELSKKNNQTIGELIRHAIIKTFKPQGKSKTQLLKHLRELGKTANTKGINYKQLIEDGRRY